MERPEQALFPIRTVSMLTGVNAITLRAWERRYGLITPQRTPKGHRLFTQQDVERINHIVGLLERGISVGNVKPLIESYSSAFSDTSITDPDTWIRYQNKMMNAIEDFNLQSLDQVYNDAMSLYPVDVVNQRLLTPLLRSLGERWVSRSAGIAEEHFFSVYLRNKLGARIHHLTNRSHGQILLLACLPGEYHELGLLFFALSALNSGYRVIVLGTNIPLAQIPPVLERCHCDGIVLACSSQPETNTLERDLVNLVKGTNLPVFVGGKVTLSHEDKIKQAGAISLDDNIIHGLRLINQFFTDH